MTAPMTIRAWRDALVSVAPGLAVSCDEPMARHTTLRIGGPADLFVEPSGTAEVAAVVRACRMAECPLTVVGNGSNLLVRDGGIRGVVLHLGMRFAGCYAEGTALTAQAGLMMSALARKAASAGLAGLAFAEGIPGTVGGGAAMNAGAYGGEMAQVVDRVTAVDGEGYLVELGRDALDYRYRHSALLSGGLIATEVRFALTNGDPADIQAEMRDIAMRRREKQPLQYPSAGSTFKRPQGHFAAQLIDEAGLKGLTIGGAQVSALHAGFVINIGGATAQDVLTLMAEIQRHVMQRAGVMLEPEVRILGEDA